MKIESMSNDPELSAKMAACKTPEEILALAKKEGVKLSDEQLEDIAGGGQWTGGYYTDCPHCGKRVDVDKNNLPSQCPKCGAPWYWSNQ